MRFIYLIFLIFIPYYLIADFISWSNPPEIISLAETESLNPRVVIDSEGNVIAAWIENGEVVARTKLLEEDWENPIALSGITATNLELCIDVNDCTTAIWIENGIVKTTSKLSGENWGSAVGLSDTGATSPQIAVNTSGDMVVIWARNGNIEAIVKESGGTWPLSPSVISGVQASKPRVAYADNRVIVAVWSSLINNTFTVFSSTFSSQGVWDLGEMISSDGENCVNAAVAVDLNGNAIAAWNKYEIQDGVIESVILQSSSKQNNGSWVPPVDLFDKGIRLPGEIVLEFDGVDCFFLARSLSFDGATFSLESAHKRLGLSQWEGYVKLIGENIHSAKINSSMRKNGVRICFLSASLGSDEMRIETAQKNFSGLFNKTYCRPRSLSEGTINAEPRIARVQIGNTEYAVAIWRHFDGQNSVIHSSFGSGVICLPPENLSVVQEFEDFHLFSEYKNVLTWSPSRQENAYGYLIYRNGRFVKRLPASATSYEDWNQNQGEVVNYGVSVINRDFTESEISYITFPSPLKQGQK